MRETMASISLSLSSAAKVRSFLKSRPFLFSLLAFASSAIGLAFFLPFFVQHGAFAGDWYNVFRPAVYTMLDGRSPFINIDFFCPPWAAVILAPIALLPRPVDWMVLVILSLTCFGIAARRMGARLPTLILFLTLPQLLWGVLYGNIDGIVALGLTLPPQIGLALVLLKPQIGFPVAIFWLIEAWRKGKFREVLRTFGPVTVLILLSFVGFGFWPAAMRTPVDRFWNIAHFPYLIPVGIILILKSIRQRNQHLAILSGPFLAPYIGAQSLPLAVLGLLPSQMETIAAILSMWVVWFLHGPF